MNKNALQSSFFDAPVVPEIPGLQVVDDFITAADAQNLLTQIDARPWQTDLKRRVQHYGYRYDYTARSVTPHSYLGVLPDFLTGLARRLHAQNLFATIPDQVIVNEYLPGQGISAHIDCVRCFGPVVASLSLGSACIMQFQNGAQKIERVLYPHSLTVLSGPSRYEWTHAIPARLNDIILDTKTPRTRRVSLTFRTISIG